MFQSVYMHIAHVSISLYAYSSCFNQSRHMQLIFQSAYIHIANVSISLDIGLSLLCFQILQLFFPEILFKFTYYSQNYSHILIIIPKKQPFLVKPMQTY